MIRILRSTLILLSFLSGFTFAQSSDYYKQEEITFRNGRIKFAGTLSLPFSSIKHPAVILISGSGAQDRNYNNWGFEMFKVMADYFARNNFAVLCFDDRGTGGSTGDLSKASIKDISKDILAAVSFLKTRPEIDTKHIGLCGHSEGGVVASMTASQSKDVDFIIIMSGYAVSGDKLLISQFRGIMKTYGTPDSVINEEAAVREKFFSLVKKGQNKTQISKQLKKYLLETYNKRCADFKTQAPNKEEYAKNMTETLTKDCDNPAFRYFLEYDPASALSRVKCSVLATFGGKDIQVPAEENKAALINALNKGGNHFYEVKVFPEANHLYELAKTGGPQEYGELKKEFLPGYIEYVNQWMANLFPQESGANLH